MKIPLVIEKEKNKMEHIYKLLVVEIEKGSKKKVNFDRSDGPKKSKVLTRPSVDCGVVKGNERTSSFKSSHSISPAESKGSCSECHLVLSEAASDYGGKHGRCFRWRWCLV